MGKYPILLILQSRSVEYKKMDQQRTFIFCGDKKVGKSSLINKLLGIQVNSQDQIKEKVALQYKFGNSTFEDYKTKVITYELGGGRVLSNLLQSPLSMNNLINVASICVVIDLSKPGNCIESLLFWIAEVKKYSMASLKELK